MPQAPARQTCTVNSTQTVTASLSLIRLGRLPMIVATFQLARWPSRRMLQL